ncbi:serine hydrolase [Adhaeribacter radiodurans]|uniref:Serine hydrolase n=1 Tax=Adhaeribacter radiodurans TaxID=2745197 RepID=A0A7L7L923_9BACT|nr:serine hydrolase [Adhaeribacter radiodurans]QMU29224.1 serine hydrolase [Adhaeribacter radiodurans]
MLHLLLIIIISGFLSVVSITSVQAQLFKRKLLPNLLKKHPEYFKNILADPAKYRIQIIYTQINRDKQNQPHFKTFTYRLNPHEYFYPASTVKLPGALLALEKLNNLHIPGLNKDTPLRIDSAYAKQTVVVTDSTAPNNLPSIAHYIKKIFLVSDNDAYNRLYEFLGQEQLSEVLRQKGYSDVRLLHRLSVGDVGETTRYTNPITFYQNDKIIYQQPLVQNTRTYSNALKNIHLGKGYYNARNQLINQPMDFSDRNYINLETLHQILKSVIFPEAVPAQQRFHLTPDDYDFVLKYMSMKPSESSFPHYDTTTYYDTYAKFFMFGNRHKTMPPNIRIFNKIGNAYGFMIDNAYIVDFENKVEFLLSAVVLGNEDNIFNDDKYEYETICYPFLINLGQVIYQNELKRTKKHLPDLSRFIFTY